MRKNVFIKSMLRQPLRTALLVLLIGVASFAFVLRTAEFVIVRRQIYATAEYYRSTGFLSHPLLFGDVNEGVALLTDSPHINLEDYRRSAEGIMRGQLNADFGGMQRRMAASREGRMVQPRFNETFFYAYVINALDFGYGHVTWGEHRAILQVEVCSVLVGHPEYVQPGQQLNLNFHRGAFNYAHALGKFFGDIGALGLPDPTTVDLPEGFVVAQWNRALVTIDWENPPPAITVYVTEDGNWVTRWDNLDLFPPEIIWANNFMVYTGPDFVPPDGWEWLVREWDPETAGDVAEEDWYDPWAYRDLMFTEAVGGRYLFRAIYMRHYPGFDDPLMNYIHGPIIPTTETENALEMWPINMQVHTPREQIWFWPVPTGEEADFSLPELAPILDDIERIYRDIRSMQLQTTRDMRDMPAMVHALELMQGRLLDDVDYDYARPVAVIDQGFALARGVEVGDTLVLDVPREQHFSDVLRLPGFVVPLVRVEREHPERYGDYFTLELEVVGVTRFTEFTRESNRSLVVFIPDSVLPREVGVLWRQFGIGEEIDPVSGAARMVRVEYEPIVFGNGHMPDVWYSFVLANPRFEDQFVEAYRYHLEMLGIELLMHYANAENFWASADPILLSITFNAALFWLVLALVLGLVAFLFIRQRRRDFAIMRSLGISAKRVYLRLALAAMLFGIPAIGIGGFLGWEVAREETEATMAAFEAAYDDALVLTPFEIQWYEFFGELPERGVLDGRREIDLTVELEQNLLFLLLGIVFAALIIVIMSGGFATLRLPVLAQLQGGRRPNYAKKRTRKASEGREDSSFARASGPGPDFSMGLGSVPEKNSLPLLAMFRFTLRHIRRSPMKSGLGALVAVFFVLFLGWLTDSIVQTEGEIERHFDTTIVQAELSAIYEVNLAEGRVHVFGTTARTEQVEAGGDEDGQLLMPAELFPPIFEDEIRRASVQRIQASGYVYNHYLEAPFERSVIVPLDDEGELPHNWRVRVHLPGPEMPLWMVRGLNRYNHTLGISCVAEFLSRNTVAAGLMRLRDVYQDNEAAMDALAERTRNNVVIQFYDGFDDGVFADYTPAGNVPVIVALDTFLERELELGDEAYMAYALHGHSWRFRRVEIVGVHNGQIQMRGLQNATLMPIWAFDRHFMGFQFITAEFGIKPEHNRDLNHVRHAWELVINPVEFEPNLTLAVHESELNTIVGALTQILTLLELMYPVAITLAVGIGFGLSILLMLQNSLNAAILRVLGASGTKARFILWSEQFIICVFGLIIGLGVVFIMGLGLGTVVVLAGLYLAGYALGCAVGAVMITRKPPLELLQVRE